MPGCGYTQTCTRLYVETGVEADRVPAMSITTPKSPRRKQKTAKSPRRKQKGQKTATKKKKKKRKFSPKSPIDRLAEVVTAAEGDAIERRRVSSGFFMRADTNSKLRGRPRRNSDGTPPRYNIYRADSAPTWRLQPGGIGEASVPRLDTSLVKRVPSSGVRGSQSAPVINGDEPACPKCHRIEFVRRETFAVSRNQWIWICTRYSDSNGGTSHCGYKWMDSDRDPKCPICDGNLKVEVREASKFGYWCSGCKQWMQYSASQVSFKAMKDALRANK